MNLRRTVALAFGLAVTAALFLHEAGVVALGPVRQFEGWLYDARVVATLPRGLDPRIVIVDLDERSLKELGRWPWGRDKVAALVGNLFDHYGAAAVAFDVVFAEPDTSSGLQALEALSRSLGGEPSLARAIEGAQAQLDFDGRFAASLAKGPAVLGYYMNPHAERSGVLPPAPLAVGDVPRDMRLREVQGYGGNLPALQARAAAAGFFDIQPDPDGVMRRMHVLQRYGDGIFDALPLATLRATFDARLTVREIRDGWRSGEKYWLVEVGDLRIPVDAQGAAFIPYRAFPGFHYVSAAEVVAKRAPKADLEGRIVLVGTTAPGLLDLRVTPFANAYPGVEVHGNVISGALDDIIPYAPGYARDLVIGLVLVLGLGLSILLPRLSAVQAAVLAGVIFFLILAGSFLAWRGRLVFPTAGVATLVFLVAGFNMAWGFIAESRDRRKITGLFGQYVPPELVEEMSHDPASFSMKSESKEMTVLFSDIRGFTTISEGLTPQQLSDVLNAYLTEMTHVIHQRRGTIDKYIGDAVMAFWGAPVAVPGHAREAVLAGLEMQAKLADMNRDFVRRGWPEIHIGVGVNTGRMSVGNMGSEFRMAYTVMGDAVNLASRLEGLTKQYGVKILIGEQTRATVPDIVCLEVDRVRVKGKEKPVSIFEPLGDEASVGENGLVRARRFGEALDAYRNRRWDQAETILGQLAAESPSKLWDVYHERITHFRAAPPPADWDGVWVFETK